ncbi:RNA polymerase sigma factor [Paenibacillus thalictri]|uniref:RNA polymerase sigma factor n=1 Tax=Paenibacillus thalictri TaxID=2527873 RepID=A0A4Q9DHI3_9BACL|nr:RNA polymerase sigma factor [Paenibacillus thalictri]TBL70885.1 RNA polymerase sigma factor [Paenibacillus thalictri]
MTEKDLFETYKKDVYRTCYFMLHHAADAEDVCQEVFLTVFRHDWRQVEHLKTWLMRVTVNHCLNHLKKNSRKLAHEKRLQQQTAGAAEKAAETVAEEREAAKECVHLLSRLPGKMRAVVSLRFINECSLSEVADILGIPVGTVKSRLNKGLKLMKRMVQPNGEHNGEEGGAYGKGRTNVYSLFRR